MFENRIKALRKANGMTVKELSEKIGVSQSMLTNYENHISKPRNDDVWIKLAGIFKVSIPYLLGLTEDAEVND